MSAFIALPLDDKIIIAADTIVTSRLADGGFTPIGFTSKIHPLIQKRAVIVGVGVMDLIVKWRDIANRCILASDILALNEYSPEAMRRYLLPEMPNSEEAYVCIYQMGFDLDGCIHCFKYDSADAFTSSPLPNNIFYRPGYSNVIENVEQTKNPFDYLFLMLECLKKNSENESPNHIGSIGGSMELAILTKYGFSTQIYKNFSDYDLSYQMALSHCR